MLRTHPKSSRFLAEKRGPDVIDGGRRRLFSGPGGRRRPCRQVPSHGLFSGPDNGGLNRNAVSRHRAGERWSRTLSAKVALIPTRGLANSLGLPKSSRESKSMVAKGRFAMRVTMSFETMSHGSLHSSKPVDSGLNLSWRALSRTTPTSAIANPSLASASILMSASPSRPASAEAPSRPRCGLRRTISRAEPYRSQQIRRTAGACRALLVLALDDFSGRAREQLLRRARDADQFRAPRLRRWTPSWRGRAGCR